MILTSSLHPPRNINHPFLLGNNAEKTSYLSYKEVERAILPTLLRVSQSNKSDLLLSSPYKHVLKSNEVRKKSERWCKGGERKKGRNGEREKE